MLTPLSDWLSLALAAAVGLALGVGLMAWWQAGRPPQYCSWICRRPVRRGEEGEP